MKYIMAVCKGNCDRSPSVEAVGNRFFREIGAHRDYQVISSGVDVKRILDGDYTPKEIVQSLGVGERMGWKSEAFDRFKEYAAKDEGLISKAQTQEVLQLFLTKGREERDAVLSSLGFRGAKRTSEQTVARDDVIAVLPVDMSCYERTMEIYEKANLARLPLIAPLGKVASIDGTDYVDYDMGKGEDMREAYRGMIQRIASDTPKALTRLLREF